VPLDDRVAERHRVFRGLVEILEAIEAVVLVIEDLHWADEQTVDFLRYLLAQPGPALRVVLTYRSDEVAPEVRALTARLPASMGQAHLVLRPFDESATGALAAAILGTDSLSDAFAAKLCERSSGIPFAIEELLAVLRARGTLVPRGDGWARRTIDELAVPTSIRDSVLERVGRLSEDARSVLEAAAVLQTPMPFEVLAATCPVLGDRASRGVIEALESSLLVDDQLLTGFRHVLAAQTVYDSLVLPRRLELHSRAADALERVRPVPLGPLAHHLGEAGRVEEWAIVAEQAAAQAIELGHEDEAIRLLHDVLRKAPLEAVQRGRLAVALGSAGARAGRASAVVDTVAAALDEGDELPESIRGQLRFWQAMLLHIEGKDAARQHRLWSEAVAELSERPDLRAWAMTNLAMPVAPGIAMAEHLAWLRRARQALRTVDDRALEVFLLGKAAMVMTVVGDPEWRVLTEDLERLTAGVPRNRSEVSAYHSVGADACYAGHHEDATRLLAAALDGADTCGSPRPELYVRSSRALLAYCTGAWAGLDDELVFLADKVGDDWPHQVGIVLLSGCLALARGQFEVARKHLIDDLPESAPIDGDVLPLRTAALLRLGMVTGDRDAAKIAERFLTRLEAKPMWPPAARALPPMVEATVADGRIAEAHALVARFADKLRGLDAPLARPALSHARGFLHYGGGDLGAAATHFRAAADGYDALHSLYEAAQVREQAAGCLFGIDDAAAGVALTPAVSTYDALGAAWDLGRAARLARDRGVRLPGRHRGGSRGYGGELSPREREVAELAASGHTNKDIADQLYLSPNTVKRHLTAVMRKLDVRSRTALAHRFATAAADSVVAVEDDPFG
jgi:DNA-binding CsgD family transcriptional regulator